MTIDPTNVGGAGLIDRVKNILLTPQAEWDRIASEPAEVNKLYVGYALPLIVLVAICTFIGLSVIGASAFGVSYRVPMVAGAISAVLQVVLGLAGLFVMAFITNALAPTFGSQQDMGQAHKLAVYGSTAGILAGVFAIFPPIAILGILGLYSLALIYIGLPRLMKTPEDKRIGYIVTIIIVSIVVWLVIGAVMGAIRTSMGGGGGPGYTFGQQTPTAQTPAQGEVTLPGGGTIDMAELEKQAQAMQSGAPAIDPARLQAQLPQSLPGGFSLTSTSSGAAMGAANAEGVYENGAQRIEVTITHMGAMGAIAGFAQSANVQQSSTSADGFARTSTVDGRVYTEEVSTSRGTANYSVIGRGIVVAAEGSGGVSLDQARAAVEVIGVSRLEGALD